MALGAILVIFMLGGCAIAAYVYFQKHKSTVAVATAVPVVSQAQKDAALAAAKANAAALIASQAAADASAAATPPAAASPVYKPLYNWNDTGNSIEDHDTTSADDCKKLCNSTKDCLYYVTDSGGTECSMKKAGTPVWKYNIDKITYATDDKRKGWSLPYDAHPGFDTVGTDVAASKGSPAECGAACAANQKCEYFVTDSDGSCLLRSGQKSVTRNSNRTTYNRPGGAYLGKNFASYYKWDVSSSDIGQQTSNSPDACGLLCMNTNGCSMYVTDAAGSLCWLKGAGSPTYKPDTSRIVYVPIDPSNPSSGLQLPYDRHAGYDTAGHDVDQKAVNAADCSGLCASNKACDFYVTNQNDNQCWLKSNPGKPTKSQDRNTFLPSGSPFNP